MSHPLVSKVQQIVDQNKVAIFMKGTPDFPACGFSARAVALLKQAGAQEIKGVDVLSDDPLWDALEDLTKWPTVPQIFLNGQFVGGCDILTEMYEKGELQQIIGS